LPEQKVARDLRSSGGCLGGQDGRRAEPELFCAGDDERDLAGRNQEESAPEPAGTDNEQSVGRIPCKPDLFDEPDAAVAAVDAVSLAVREPVVGVETCVGSGLFGGLPRAAIASAAVPPSALLEARYRPERNRRVAGIARPSGTAAS
jgi:hypothetical protein